MESQNHLGGKKVVGFGEVSEKEAMAKQKLKDVAKLVDGMKVPYKEMERLMSESWGAFLEDMAADLLRESKQSSEEEGQRLGGPEEEKVGGGSISEETTKADGIVGVTSEMLANKEIIVAVLKILDETTTLLDGLPDSQGLATTVKDLKKSFQVLHELHIETGEVLSRLCPEKRASQDQQPVIDPLTTTLDGLNINHALPVPHGVDELDEIEFNEEDGLSVIDEEEVIGDGSSSSGYGAESEEDDEEELEEHDSENEVEVVADADD